jgi:Flp pilus assembly pilin Flp
MLAVCRSLVRRLVADETGQDLIEYALLTTTIGFAGIFAWTLVASAIGTTYGTWESSVDTLVIPPNPSGGGS